MHQLYREPDPPGVLGNPGLLSDCADPVGLLISPIRSQFHNHDPDVRIFLSNECSASTVTTLFLYFRASTKNPGFIQGNTLYEVAVSISNLIHYKNIGAYNPNTDVIKREGLSSQMQQVEFSNLQIMHGGAGKRNMHNRKTSVLTKGLQISRHERGRSRVPNL